jgi:lysophospholipase L1-like esterase
VTPLSRKNYRNGQLVIDELADYAVAARRAAAEDHVTLVGLYALSTKLLQGMTQEQADTLDTLAHSDAAVENNDAAKPDRTHLNGKGQQLFGRMVADDAARLEVDYDPNIEGVPDHLPAAPALPRALLHVQ